MRDSRPRRMSLSHRLRSRFIVLASIPAGLGWVLFGATTPVHAQSLIELLPCIVGTIQVTAESFTATEGVAFAGEVATWTEPAPLATIATSASVVASASAPVYKALITWETDKSDIVTLTPTNHTDGSVTGTVSGTHTYAEETSEQLFQVRVFKIVDNQLARYGCAAENSTVNDALVLTVKPIAPTEGSTFDGVVATFTNEDPTAVAADFRGAVLFENKCPSKQAGTNAARQLAAVAVTTTAATIVKNGSLWEVHSSHTYSEEGSYDICVGVEDIDGANIQLGSGTAVVANAALTATKGADITTTENGPNGPYVVATFTDANGAPDAADFSAKIKWGDGSADSNGTVDNNTSGPGFQVSGFHGYHEGGSFTVAVTITDRKGDDETTATTATATLTATVTDAALHATNGAGATSTEGSSTGTLTLATFTDSSDAEEPLSTYSATVDWKDGSTSNCSSTSTTCSISFNDSTSKLEVKSSHTYVEEGTYVAHVTISDKGGATATADDSIKVNDAALTAANGKAINAQQNQSTGDVVTATFTDANPTKDKADFTATIDWGDGNTSAGTVSVAEGTFSVTGSHTYTSPGSFTVKTSITDTGGSTKSATAAASVAAPPTLATTGIASLIPPWASGYAFLGGLLLVLGVLGWWAVLRDRFVWSSKKLR